MIYSTWSSATGMGHVKRCIALTQALTARGIETGFFLTNMTPALEQEILDAGASAHSGTWVDAVDQLQETPCGSWILFDDPELESDQELSVNALEHGRLAILDGQFRNHHCDLLINPNIYASEENCRPTVPHSAQILAGYEYFILDDRYLERNEALTAGSRAGCSVLLTLGGSDPSNQLTAVCRELTHTLRSNPSIHLDIIVGPAHHDPNSVDEYVRGAGLSNVAVHFSPASLFEILVTADICICAGGTTLSEAVYLNKPTLSIETADNQRPVIDALKSRGATIESSAGHLAVDLNALLADLSLRQSLIDKTIGLLDGRGKHRIAEAFAFCNISGNDIYRGTSQ